MKNAKVNVENIKICTCLKKFMKMHRNERQRDLRCSVVVFVVVVVVVELLQMPENDPQKRWIYA